MANQPIHKWQKQFNVLYGKIDLQRKPEDFWLAIIDHFSQIGESIRKLDYPATLKKASHAFAWMCEFVNFCNKSEKYPEFLLNNLNLSEIIGLKYPLVCGHCGEKQCACNAKIMEEIDDKSTRAQNLYEIFKTVKDEIKEYSIAKWIDVFEYIYQNNTRLQSISTIGFHLLEEAGEGARAIRHLVQLRNILEEKGDVIGKDFMNNSKNIDFLIKNYVKYHRDLEIFFKNKEMDKSLQKKIYRIEETELFLKYRFLHAKMEFINELADTFAWFFSLIIKIQDMSKPMEENNWLTKEQVFDNDILDERIAEEYNYKIVGGRKLKCHSCDETECICKYYIKPCN